MEIAWHTGHLQPISFKSSSALQSLLQYFDVFFIEICVYDFSAKWFNSNLMQLAISASSTLRIGALDTVSGKWQGIQSLFRDRFTTDLAETKGPQINAFQCRVYLL